MALLLFLVENWFLSHLVTFTWVEFTVWGASLTVFPCTLMNYSSHNQALQNTSGQQIVVCHHFCAKVKAIHLHQFSRFFIIALGKHIYLQASAPVSHVSLQTVEIWTKLLYTITSLMINNCPTYASHIRKKKKTFELPGCRKPFPALFFFSEMPLLGCAIIYLQDPKL